MKLYDNGFRFDVVHCHDLDTLKSGVWLKNKLGITDEPTLKSVAYAINLKIKNEGTGIYKDNSKGLEIDDKIKTLNEKLTEDLRVFAIADIKRQLNKFQSQRL